MTEVSSIAAKSSLCSRCKETKSADQFRVYKGTKRFPYCLPCEKEYKAQHYKKNAAKVKEQSIRWRNENRERYLENNRAYYRANFDRYSELAKKWAAKNPDKRLEISRKYRTEKLERARQNEAAYRERNREICNARIREWKAKNKPLIAYYSRTRHAVRRNAVPAWADLEAIKLIYEEAARRRAETGEDWHVDHIVPLKGKTVCGLHCEANLQIIPKVENLRKNATRWPDMP